MNQDSSIPVFQRYCALIPAGIFLLLSLICIVASTAFPSLVSELGCNRHNLLNGKLYTILTYAFTHASLVHLISVICSLFLAVYFLGEMLSRTEIWVLVVSSIALGAILFCFLMKERGVLIGGAMMTWGFAGAVLALAIIKWRSLNLVRRAYSILLGLFATGLVFTFLFNLMSLVQLLITLAAFLSTYLRHRKSRALPAAG